jgi:hypothetical protein
MDLWKVFRFQFGSQVAQSRNLREGLRLKVWRSVWASFYLVKGIRSACFAVRREQLGSSVVFNGMRCWVSNWAGSEWPTLSGPGFYAKNVPRAEIQSIINVGEILHRFRSGFSFYMTSWHSIDVNKKLYRA